MPLSDSEYQAKKSRLVKLGIVLPSREHVNKYIGKTFKQSAYPTLSSGVSLVELPFDYKNILLATGVAVAGVGLIFRNEIMNKLM